MDISNHHHHKSVYIVEDDIELSSVMDRVLKTIDPKVNLDWCTSAEEAIEKIHGAWSRGIAKPYDLIIADVFLDGSQSGLDFWNLCKREFPTIPVILTSASPLEKFFPPNVDLTERPILLQKPFSLVECKKLFKNLLA